MRANPCVERLLCNATNFWCGSIGVLGGVDKRTFRDRRVQVRQLLLSAIACARPNRSRSLVVRVRQVQLSKSTSRPEHRVHGAVRVANFRATPQPRAAGGRAGSGMAAAGGCGRPRALAAAIHAASGARGRHALAAVGRTALLGLRGPIETVGRIEAGLSTHERPIEELSPSGWKDNRVSAGRVVHEHSDGERCRQ